MTEPIQTDSGVRSIRRLTIAVWVLGVLTIVNIGISLFGALLPLVIGRPIRFPFTKGTFPLNTAAYQDQYAGFHEWPLERQVQKASVIVVARYEKENEKLKCVISEILKQAPDTEFHYKVGDEYRPGTIYLHGGDIIYGDGQIIFFTGSPASMRYSCSFEGDSMTGYGNMPMETLRETIRKAR